MPKLVYDFTEGNKDLKDLLGGKGANLAEMTSVLGLPVPPGFTIATTACRSYMEGGWPEGLTAEIAEGCFEHPQQSHIVQRIGKQAADQKFQTEIVDPFAAGVVARLLRRQPAVHDAVAQRVQDLVHLERRRQGLDQDRGLDGAVGGGDGGVDRPGRPGRGPSGGVAPGPRVRGIDCFRVSDSPERGRPGR